MAVDQIVWRVYLPKESEWHNTYWDVKDWLYQKDYEFNWSIISTNNGNITFIELYNLEFARELMSSWGVTMTLEDLLDDFFEDE